jgi:microcystin-dependent protein
VEPLIGQISMFAFNFAPSGWALCDGKLWNIEQNTVLHSLIGTTYGGDGKTTFALPNLAPYQGIRFYIAYQGVYPRRD